jgi:folate-binding protein YgfZ
LRRGAPETWQAADLAAGIPWVGISTQDMFIPQSVNLDLIGGINFTKGCYPGQEVVARSHYLGKLKRRMAYGVVSVWDQPSVMPGTDIFLHQPDQQPGEPCGRVVEDAIDGSTLSVLFEVAIKAQQAALQETGKLCLGSATGPTIQLQPLPYAV